jgi:hypothetical protein
MGFEGAVGVPVLEVLRNRLPRHRGSSVEVEAVEEEAVEGHVEAVEEEIVLRAERRLGDLLAGMFPGQDGDGKSSHSTILDVAPTRARHRG